MILSLDKIDRSEISNLEGIRIKNNNESLKEDEPLFKIIGEIPSQEIDQLLDIEISLRECRRLGVIK